MSANTAERIGRVCAAIMFENWLRFYFLEEEGESLVIRIPVAVRKPLERDYPELCAIAEALHGREAVHESSVAAVCACISAMCANEGLSETVMSDAFDDPALQLELHLFSFWLQEHEEELDAVFLEFSVWLRRFFTWKEKSSVRRLTAELKKHFGSTAHSHISTLQ